ncbi:MAG: hypothetical protein RBR15_00965 [Sphaerochaeta sp.]|nr:hypothetical protein [Sphaerochaeta sp.]
MNKTWSIILIVVALLVILGGTYWYFGMQKPKTQEVPKPTTVVEAAKPMVGEGKGKGGTAALAKTEPPLPKLSESPAEPKPVDSEPVPAKPMPAPIAPSIVKGGGFVLPTLGTKGDAKEPDSTTSVLAREALAPKAEVSTPPVAEEVVILPEPEPVVAGPAIEEETIPEPVEEVVVPESPVVAKVEDEPIPPVVEQEIPEVVVDEPAAEVMEPAPVETIPIAESPIAEEPKPKDEKATIKAGLSVSFLDYNFPKEFSSSEKSFNVNMDLMSHKDTFGWGGALEVGKNTTTNIMQISLLAKAEWTLGKGEVTFPLSISLGPTLFIDTTLDTTAFGMKAKLGAGVTYTISESFRIFYAVGAGAIMNFKDSTSLRFVLEPIRVGIGFSF